MIITMFSVYIEDDHFHFNFHYNLAPLDNSHQPIQQQKKIPFLKSSQFLTIAKRKRKNDTGLALGNLHHHSCTAAASVSVLTEK